MMLSKGNLTVVGAAPKPPRRGEKRQAASIYGVRVEPDGSTVATDRNILMAVSPASETYFMAPGNGIGNVPRDGVILDAIQCKEVLKWMKEDVNNVSKGATLSVGGGKTADISIDRPLRTSSHPLIDSQFPGSWRELTKKAGKEKQASVVVYANHLASLLLSLMQTVSEAGDRGFPVELVVSPAWCC